MQTAQHNRSIRRFCLFVFSLASLHLFGACPYTLPPVGCPAQTPGHCSTPPGNTYILRYAVNGEHGAMTFIGNTLGLSKALCENEPGVLLPVDTTTDAIGAFTTTDPSMSVDGYPRIAALMTSGPAGTTLDWTKNGSSAVLSIPLTSTILYAELIWSGSYGFYCENPVPTGVDPNCILNNANGPILFTTADGNTHMITADPATSMVSQNPAPDVQPNYCAGNYVRTANVTSLFTAPSLMPPNGTYTVARVPATVSQFDNTHNAAGWTLAIVYRDPLHPINNMSLFVSNQQAQRPPFGAPATVSGFCASTMPANARVLVSAIEGDPNKIDDHFEFAPSIAQLSLPAFQLTGPNNPPNNFFCSQINDDNGILISTTGTFCTKNAVPPNLTPGGRQGYDITNVDGTATLAANQMMSPPLRIQMNP